MGNIFFIRIFKLQQLIRRAADRKFKYKIIPIIIIIIEMLKSRWIKQLKRQCHMTIGANITTKLDYILLFYNSENASWNIIILQCKQEDDKNPSNHHLGGTCGSETVFLCPGALHYAPYSFS